MRPRVVEGVLLNGTPSFVFHPELSKPIYTAVTGAVCVAPPHVWAAPAYPPLGSYAVGELSKLLPNADWDQSAVPFLERLAASDELPTLPDDFFPKGFEPFDYQLEGIKIAANWWRAFFLWEMGLGKTRVLIDGLRIAALSGEVRRIAVITVRVAVDVWIREVYKCTSGKWTAVAWDSSSDVKAFPDAQVIVFTYEGVRRLALQGRNPMLELGVDAIVIDESHSLGSPTTQRTRVVTAIAADVPRRYLLTGTAGDDPVKLFAQLRLLAPGLLQGRAFDKYQQRYLVFAPNNRYIVSGYRRLDELNAVVAKVATRKTKAECLSLPPVTVVDRYYNLGLKQRARYNELVVAHRASLQPLMDFLDPTAAQEEELEELPKPLLIATGGVKVNKLLQLTSGFLIESADESICDGCDYLERCVDENIRPYTRKCLIDPKPQKRVVLRDIENPKLELAEELLDTALVSDADTKVVIWASFRDELDDLQRLCASKNYGVVRLDGSTSHQTGAIVDKFQTDPTCRVFLGLTGLGIGITLTAASVVIYYALPWRTDHYTQSFDRVNRPGQKKKVTVYRLLSSEATAALDRFVANVLAFKDKTQYTMTGMVLCTACQYQSICMRDQVAPFSGQCVYSAERLRPVVKPKALKGSP